VLGAIAGLLFGLFLGADLWLFGIVRSDSVLITLLPLLGLIGGVLIGLFPPFRRGRAASLPPAPDPVQF
jgi:hypothetical protein